MRALIQVDILTMVVISDLKTIRTEQLLIWERDPKFITSSVSEVLRS